MQVSLPVVSMTSLNVFDDDDRGVISDNEKLPVANKLENATSSPLHFMAELTEDTCDLGSNNLSISSLVFDMNDHLEPTPFHPDDIRSTTKLIVAHEKTFLSPNIDSMSGTFAIPSLSCRPTVKRDCLPMDPDAQSITMFDPNQQFPISDLNSEFVRQPSSRISAVEPLMNSIDASILNKPQRSSVRPNSSGLSNQKWCESGNLRAYHSDQWMERLEELKEFQAEFGHCLVPHSYLHHGSPALAQWVKRQRFQWKQRVQHKRTTITDERKELLDSLGFIWDSHRVAWEEKFTSLVTFKQEHGHVGVPSKYEDKNLAIWVKCQRRQYKLFCQCRKSAMTPERIARLDALEFNWNPRNL